MDRIYEAKNIGVLFGSFNPPHKSHARLLQLAMNRYGLDQIYVIPLEQTYSKRAIPQAQPEDKLTMCKLAFGDIPNCEVLPPIVNTNKSPVSQQIHTLRTLLQVRKKHPESSFRVIAGEDYIKKHQRVKNLLKTIKRIADKAPQSLTAIWNGCLKKSVKLPLDDLNFVADIGYAHFTREETQSISSTFIRDAIMCGQPLEPYLSCAVIEYIHGNELFTKTQGNPQYDLKKMVGGDGLEPPTYSV